MKLKKMLAAVLTMAMVATALPVTAFAEIAEKTVAGQEELNVAVAEAESGTKIVLTKEGTYNLPSDIKANLTIAAADNVAVTFNAIGAHKTGPGDLVFENVIFDYYPNANYTGLQHSGNLVYEGCTFNGQAFLYGNSETFNGCTFNQNSADAYNVWTYGANKVEFNGCTFNCAGKSVLVYNEGDGPTELIVKDTDFIASNPVEGKAAIEVDTTLMPEGTKITIDADTTVTGFGVGNVSGNSLWNDKKDQTDLTITVAGEKVWPIAIAKIGNTEYYSLAAAVNAAKDGETVTLLDSVSGSSIVIDKDITIDFGGKTYTFTTPAVGSEGTTTNGFQILKDNDVVLKNGGLKVADENAAEYYILVQNYANLIVSGMTLDGTNLDKYSDTDGDSYVLSNNNGDVIITGNTTIIANDKGALAYAFDVCDYASYDGVTVTFDSNFTGKVNGNFEVTNPNGGENNATLKISGGYFTQDPTSYVVGNYKVEPATGDYAYKVVERTVTVEEPDVNAAAGSVDTTEATFKEGITAPTTEAITEANKAVAANNAELKTFVEDTNKIMESAKEAALDALTEEGVTIPDTPDTVIEITVVPTIETKIVSASATEVKVEIEAVNVITATVDGKSATTKQDLDTTGTAVNVTIPLPTGFTPTEQNADGNIVHVTHIKDDGAVYTHIATVDEGGKTATFKNDKGFSEFIITVDPTVAVDGANNAYKTLQAAVNEAKTDGTVTTIKLVSNVTGAGVKVPKNSNMNIVFDLNGHTYTVNSPVGSSGTVTLGFQLNTGNKVTIKNGTLTSEAGSGVKMLINNYDDLTLIDVTLDGSDLDEPTSGNVNYTLSNNAGNIVITGETNIKVKNKDTDVAFDVCDSSSYSEATNMTFESTGTVEGKIEVSDSADASLNISSGTFTNPVATKYLDADYVVVTDDGFSYYESQSAAQSAAQAAGVGTPVYAVDSLESDGTVGDATPVYTAPKKSSSKKYSASVDKDDIENGKVTLNTTRAKKGATVTITVTPDEGYELDELKVLDDDGNEIEVKDKGDGKYTFVMPKGGVEIEASFEEIDEDEPVVDEPAVDKPADEEETLVLTINQVFYLLNGTYEANDVAPIIKGDRTMLPIRLIAEFLGATVTWNEAEQSVTIVKDDTTIVIYIGQAFALVNGEPVQLDAPAFIMNDRTYLPLRFIAENLGAEVIWDGAAQTVTVIG